MIIEISLDSYCKTCKGVVMMVALIAAVEMFGAFLLGCFV